MSYYWERLIPLLPARLKMDRLAATVSGGKSVRSQRNHGLAGVLPAEAATKHLTTHPGNILLCRLIYHLLLLPRKSSQEIDAKKGGKEMFRAACLIHSVGTAIGILFLALPASAALQPVVQEFGQISISVDAEGNNNSTGGTIRVDKPSGATIHKAFLMANSHGLEGDRIISDGEITLAGVPITWDRSEFNGIPGDPSFFHNVFAEVTSVVKPIIDAAPPGITELLVTEVGTTQINGTILVVIFDDPNETSDNSIILLFGGQATVGETFLINFGEPINRPLDRADMGIGIGHGFQGFTGTPMVNAIDVNGVRLTSSAGGEDDGAGFNGAR